MTRAEFKVKAQEVLAKITDPEQLRPVWSNETPHYNGIGCLLQRIGGRPAGAQSFEIGLDVKEWNQIIRLTPRDPEQLVDLDGLKKFIDSL